MKKFIVLIALIMSFVTAFAQQTSDVEMADALRSSGKIYVVIITISIIFVGLAVYLFSMDRRLTKLEKEKLKLPD